MQTSKRPSHRSCAGVLLGLAGLLGGVAACASSEDLAGNGGATSGAAPDAGAPNASGSGGAGPVGGHTGGAGASGGFDGSAIGGDSGTPTGAGGIAGSDGGTDRAMPDASGGSGGNGGSGGGPGSGRIKHVFVITMENEAAAAIYGSASAPYINSQLLPAAARANAFADPLPDAIPSEPHYVWMEAGTNQFSDATFTTDSDPSAQNSTASTAHLATQMDTASPTVSWRSYQEGLNASTGACPVRSSGFYVAKHDPYVFFQDIAGNPPSASSALCAAHHRAYTPAAFAQDLQAGTVAQYNFITPTVCHDMHGASGCPGSDDIRSGDDWLAAAMPPLIAYAGANDGVIFIVWDEPVGGSTLIPFIAIGPHVKPGYASSVRFTHSSLTKTVEEIFGLPLLPSVASANDLSDLFLPGALQ